MDATYDLTLKAEIVGVMEGSDQQSMKVLVEPLYLTIPAELQLHLGETVLIEAALTVQSIRPDIETEEHTASPRQ